MVASQKAIAFTQTENIECANARVSYNYNYMIVYIVINVGCSDAYEMMFKIHYRLMASACDSLMLVV